MAGQFGKCQECSPLRLRAIVEKRSAADLRILSGVADSDGDRFQAHRADSILLAACPPDERRVLESGSRRTISDLIK
jgi:hypothetical protein